MVVSSGRSTIAANAGGKLCHQSVRAHALEAVGAAGQARVFQTIFLGIF